MSQTQNIWIEDLSTNVIFLLNNLGKGERRFLKRIVSGIMLILLFVSMIPLTFYIQSVEAKSAIITVPDNYSTIQGAINAANEGDIIYIKAWTYYENVVVNKSVTLVGENKETTVIDGGRAGTVIDVVTSNVTITRFKIQNSGKTYVGISVSHSSHVNITENIVIDNGNGIGLDDSHDNLIGGNTITCNNEGLLLTGARTVVRDNIIVHNGFCGVTVFGDNNTLTGNTLTDNGEGIRLLGYDNLIANNIISVNGCGLLLDKCSNNIIYHNNFVKNKQQTNSIESYNTWDEGYPKGGNYWSDYKEDDKYEGPNQDQTGSDGIGDKPYIIVEDNSDRYPLMKPIFAHEHDVAITVWVPTSIINGTPTTIQVSLCNLGLSNETGVHLELMIDGVTVKSETISDFISGSTYALDHTWTPSIEGVYNVTAHVIPLLEEYTIINNVKSVQVNVYSVVIGPAKIYFQQSGNEITAGTTFTINLMISNVTDLYGWDAKTYYRNDILEAIDANEGLLLKTGGPTMWIPSKIANDYNVTHGYVYIGCTLLGDIKGVNGSGVLATIAFRAKAPGNSTLCRDPEWTGIVNSELEPVFFEADDGYVTVAIGLYGDLNNDGKVDIQDVAVAASAFGSYPGHPRWNPIADMNKDNIVDVKDIVLIAINFGKTEG